MSLHVLDSVAHILLFFDRQIDPLRGIVHTAGVTVDQGVQPVGTMQAVTGMRELVLQLFQPVGGK